MSYKQIQASDIATYVFCRRAWWLQRAEGHVPQNFREMKAGQQFHQQHGRTVQRALWTRRLAYALLFVVVALTTFQLLMGM